jgi:hypothetical protein
VTDQAVRERTLHEPTASGIRLETPRSRSPYRSRRTGPTEVANRRGSLAIHAAAWIATVGWLVDQRANTFDEPIVGGAVLVTSLWLLIGPCFVVAWERRLAILAVRRVQECSTSDEARVDLSTVIRRLDQWRPVFLLVPMAALAAAYIGGDDFLRTEFRMELTDISFWIGFLIIQLGTVAAGWGLWAAGKTLVLAIAIARQPCEFAPFAGTTSRSAHSLSKFCFGSAILFGAGGSFLLPGVSVAAWKTDALARGALILIIVLITLTSVLLLALPAYALSQQYQERRVEYLDDLSSTIDRLDRAVRDDGSPFSGDQYSRLRSLLELRAHVVTHAMSQSSVEMIKRIPLAVVVPVSTTLAAWLPLLAV